MGPTWGLNSGVSAKSRPWDWGLGMLTTCAFLTGREHLASLTLGFSSSYEESSGSMDDSGKRPWFSFQNYSGIFEERLSVLCSLHSS